MPLFDYVCRQCKTQFEQLVDSRGDTDPEAGRCPQCASQDSERLISRFTVAGRGDQRESTLHGCHENFDGLGHSEHNHDSHSEG